MTTTYDVEIATADRYHATVGHWDIQQRHETDLAARWMPHGRCARTTTAPPCAWSK